MKILAMSQGDADDVKKYANISLATFNKWKDFNYDFEGDAGFNKVFQCGCQRT